jgi:putative endonuclease
MKGFVYIITNTNNTVLYTGVSSNLRERMIQHKAKKFPGSFSAKYNLDKLIYYEEFSSIGDAIKREKQIKGGNRKRKIALIDSINPEWRDLSGGLVL